MIVLCCLEVRDSSIVSVNIEENKLVTALKNAIKAKNQYSIPANDLTLYLAKKDDGSWLRAANLKELSLTNVAGDFTKMDETYRLRNEAFGFPRDDEWEDGEIHVLVVVPTDQSRALGVAPIGPVVHLSPKELLALLEGEMTNKGAIVSSHHIHEAESLQFQLVGREEAIDTAAELQENHRIERNYDI